MLNIQSTNAAVDVSPEYADAVMEQVDSPDAYVEHVTRHGDFYVTVLVIYPLGADTHAYVVDYCDTASREVELAFNRADAKDRYREMVLAAGENLGEDNDGEPIAFETTDVPGYSRTRH